MGSKKQYVVVGILLLAILVGVAISHGLMWTWVQAGWDDFPILTREITLTRLISFVLAAGAAIFAIANKTVFTLANEVVDELSKVSWPTRDETTHATVVVIVTVVICSIYLGLFDSIWMWISNWVLDIKSARA